MNNYSFQNLHPDLFGPSHNSFQISHKMPLSIAHARNQSFNNGTFSPMVLCKNEEKRTHDRDDKKPAANEMCSRIEEDSDDMMDFILLDPRNVFGVSQNSSGRRCRPLLLPRPPLRSIVTNHSQPLETTFMQNGMSFIPISPDSPSVKNEAQNKSWSPLNLELDTHVNTETPETPKHFSSSRNNKTQQVDKEQLSPPFHLPQRRRDGARNKILPFMPMW
jgi:hypothetical protein